MIFARKIFFPNLGVTGPSAPPPVSYAYAQWATIKRLRECFYDSQCTYLSGNGGCGGRSTSRGTLRSALIVRCNTAKQWRIVSEVIFDHLLII